MSDSGSHTIRPAGRHILTIGRDLIQDQYAAIIELVKNAYDADSPDVHITFKVPKNRDKLTIVIKDHGHGMTKDIVINKWLVPSTDDKLKRKISPNGRTMQGRKGIGRYAASILGQDLLMETITAEGDKTEVYVEWSHFAEAEYLDNVEILVHSTETNQPEGTILTITGDEACLNAWNDSQIRSLEFELRKLVSPIEVKGSKETSDDKMDIYLNYEGFFVEQDENVKKKIEPYPLVDFYDYRISGFINPDGNGQLEYSIQKARNTVTESIQVNIEKETGCGRLDIDIRVYDREPPSIERLIKRGLKDEKGNYLGKREARQLLNKYNGIGVYRNGFRIRPMGDPEFDWLTLNKRRVQNPSQCIGSDQVIGYILIQSEELSGLEEKSARDGLRDNEAYENLKSIIQKNVIHELEIRRFQYRSKAGLSRHAVKVEKELENLFSFEDIKDGVRSKLTKSGIDEKTANEILKIIVKKEETSQRLVEDIRRAVAVYQGQATLGKIINVILHEGRRPLNFFKNQIPNLNYYASKFKENPDSDALDELLPIAGEFGQNAEVFVQLFSRLDPLASGKRGPRKILKLKEILDGAFAVFKHEFSKHKISCEIECSSEVLLNCWQQDIYSIITNLIDNSIYWMENKQVSKKQITVTVSSQGEELSYLDYRDTGPGIERHLIENEVIFEPEFSTKPGGTGLGLAIAGEAATRNNLELKAFESEIGAYFRLQPIMEG